MKDLFVTYELALLAKEKGFTEECFSFYSTKHIENNKKIFFDIDPDDHELTWLNQNRFINYRISAPVHQQLVLWFRNTHSIKIDIRHSPTIGSYTYDIWTYPVPNTIGKWEKQTHIGSYYTYIEALEKGLTEAFTLI